ncbi:MAG TPA: hypothetical protein VJL31_13005 [Gemmatimonadales bacterium]|nr:hypothetical protein [Gemmatimonadales bacterium]
MPLRIPMRALPVSAGQAPNNMVGVGYLAQDQFGFPAFPFTVLAGASADSDPILVSGFDNFMWLVTFASGGGGSVDFSYLHLDPGTLTDYGVVTTIVAALGAGTYLLTFGASSTTAPAVTRGDVWIAFKLRVTANGLNHSFSVMRLFCGVR